MIGIEPMISSIANRTTNAPAISLKLMSIFICLYIGRKDNKNTINIQQMRRGLSLIFVEFCRICLLLQRIDK